MAAPPLTCSQEQSDYIHYSGTDDTKLLATAGSGKTFCIIHHMIHLVQRGVYDSHEVIMLTFSKNARDDFAAKVRKNSADQIILRNNICTIDSFAWRCLGPVAKSIDVSILSYAFMIQLESHDSSVLKAKYSRLTQIKAVFVDEAQDLNEVQYRIIMALKQKFGIAVNLIGDPNQNIYQFRRSSDRFLVNFPARVFMLTRNYRSQGHIVDFCSFLRPYNNGDISYETPKKTALDITFYAYDDHIKFEHYLLSILHLFRAKNIPLHKVAVLAPTRGYLRDSHGLSKYKGLCYISNILFQHEIPFVQFYNDSITNGDANDVGDCGTKIKYRHVKGSVNLMTYTASKGLEWDYVIIVDANAHLITRNNYDSDKFLAERYLLYVACSRPRKNLIIFTKRKYANPWFKDIPTDKYRVAKQCQYNFDFFDTSKLFEDTRGNNNIVNVPTNLASRIAALQDASLYDIHMLLDGKVDKTITKMMHDGDPWRFSVPEGKAMLGKQFLDHVVMVFATGHAQTNNMLLVDVRNAISSNNIVSCQNEKLISWYFNNRTMMTWQTWDTEKQNLPNDVVAFVDTYMDRNIPFSSFTLIDRFYERFIRKEQATMKATYERYTNSPFDVNDMFYLTLISYAIQTTHYFYIQQYSEFCKEIVQPEQNMRALNDIKVYCKEHMNTTLANTYELLDHPQLKTIVDMRMNNETQDIYKLIFTSSVSLKDMLKGLVARIIDHTNANTHGTQQYKFGIINTRDGNIHNFAVTLPYGAANNLLCILGVDTH